MNRHSDLIVCVYFYCLTSRRSSSHYSSKLGFIGISSSIVKVNAPLTFASLIRALITSVTIIIMIRYCVSFSSRKRFLLLLRRRRRENRSRNIKLYAYGEEPGKKTHKCIGTCKIIILLMCAAVVTGRVTLYDVLKN